MAAGTLNCGVDEVDAVIEFDEHNGPPIVGAQKVLNAFLSRR